MNSWSGHNINAVLPHGAVGSQIGEAGYYVQPTLFGDVRDDMHIAQQEIFGPVQCCMKWKDVSEVSSMHHVHSARCATDHAAVYTKNCKVVAVLEL